MTETYDQKAKEEKKKIPFTQLQGFFLEDDKKYYIINQDHQFNLTTNEWEGNSILLEITHEKDEVKLAIKKISF